MVLPLLACLAALAAPSSGPRMVAYSAQPSPYITAHAPEIARIYDGMFFVVGSWDEGVARRIGVGAEPASDPAWIDTVRGNVRALAAAGAAENLLGVHFDESAAWPSEATLRSPDYTAKMARHFGALGKAAKTLGFRGVSIDVEYPYKRYAPDHPSYTYAGYTVEDLAAAARGQGRASMAALLDAFPDAVVWVLPGDFAAGLIGREYTYGLLEAMAQRDAPGGFHLGAERSYRLYDPASQVAIPRFGDCQAEFMLPASLRAYWRRRCTVAPGVWPFHMAETTGPAYPVRPWAEELAELREQLRILRATSRRYLWSFSAYPAYAPASAADRERGGFGKPAFSDPDAALAGWHDVLRDRGAPSDARVARLLGAIRSYDAGRIDAAGLCDRFGTPGDWLVLGPLGNPALQPQHTALSAANGPRHPEEVHEGRDGMVRWFRYRSLDPLGAVRLKATFDGRNTDNCSVYLVSDIVAPRATTGYLWLGWDDAAVVRINGKVVLDHSAYPARGHGMLYRDRYLFEDRVAVTIPRGRSRLAVTSVNARGGWGIYLRFADQDGYPLEGLRFQIPR